MTLKPANVNAAQFGLLRNLTVDGKVDAQPLVTSGLAVGGRSVDVVFVATEEDTVYAFDVDRGTLIWRVSLLGSGETPSDDRHCGQVRPVIGITATPVIDRSAGPQGTLFVVAMSKDGSGHYHQRLHALDLATGAESPGGPRDIAATFPKSRGGTTAFDPGQYEERAALLLDRGSIYTSWTSHCDNRPYTGWIIAYDEATLTQTAILNIGPNGDAGPAIWMSGGGPAADADGNLYLLSGNGAFETRLDAQGFPRDGDYGNSFLKIRTAGHALTVSDYFTMANEVAESATDRDLGSGGALLLPDMTDADGTVRHLVVGAGKDMTLYVVDRDSMGKFHPDGNHVWQELPAALPAGIWSTPAYFRGTLYYGAVGAPLKAFSFHQARLSSAPQSQSPSAFPAPGTAPCISANGTADGIVWAHENANPAVLHAYDATDLGIELYNSNQAANGRDHFGVGNKFITPTVVNGRVFVGTTNSVAIFGLLH
jgi:outer membrane protein assembly factor BamB